MSYRAPLHDIRFQIEAAGHGLPVDEELLDTLLDQAARFASEVLSPLNQPGDRQGARLSDGKVTTPAGFREAYAAWTASGWNSVDAPDAWGGMGLPLLIATPLMEMWTSACMALALSPVVTQGAAEVLIAHGDDVLRAAYVPQLVSGQWAGTMALTEPHAGSDLGALRTRAQPADDGSFRLFGDKIFITYGEHDLTENIVHLVLARLPDAPPGTKGISLFLVPKFLPSGERNSVSCVGIEHKLGVHAAPTCALRFEGATGWLVGAPHRGLACMFTLMNRARLATGIQGVAVAERATQAAWNYARERRQGRAQGAEGTEMSPIIAHPDVRRMLFDMRAGTLASRALAYEAAAAIDQAHHDRTEGAIERAALLTPIVKAWCSDTAFAITSTGVQVHGGAGYVEDTGAAQYLRDARIPPIYEGTNGIQAIDLVLRKIVRPGGSAARALIAELQAISRSPSAPRQLRSAVDALADATEWLFAPSRTESELLAGATPYLNLFGIALAGGLMVRSLDSCATVAPPADFAAMVHHFGATRLVLAPALAEMVTDMAAFADDEAVLAYL